MRENMGLYRGKRLDNGEWVEGWLVIKKDPVLEITYCFILAYGEGESFVTWYPVDPETVGECIGIPSKNGKLIFEGDIVRVTQEMWSRGFDGQTHGACDILIGVFEVVFCNGKFMKTRDRKTMHYFLARDMCNIIGNIHDNAELMEVN